MTEVVFTLDGRAVSVPNDGASLLEALRHRLGVRSAKDGCSPQGQCGCCTVLVDGAPRVACVTPVARVSGRTVTTVDGLAPEERRTWAEAFTATGASQCGFCTPGIILRLHATLGDRVDDARTGQALLAHLCRCTGWQTIVEATRRPQVDTSRDWAAAAARATLEGGAAQAVGPDIALGHGGFADDVAPADALVAVPDAAGGWAVADTLTEARRAAGKVQGRRSTAALRWPLDVPEGPWVATLQTTWVEPAYLELDASWCVPGGEPASPLANGGAFGGKADTSALRATARRLADEHGRAVRVLLSREDAVRWGPKRPPVAGGVTADGRGVLRVARTPGVVEAVAGVAPDLTVEEVDVAGPPTSLALRAAGWGEALVLLSALRTPATTGELTVRAPGAGTATARIDPDGAVHVRVDAGDPLDPVVLRSYVIGAVHQALGWVRNEGIAVDADGNVHDLTLRSFGILRAVDMPAVEVEIAEAEGPPVPVSDAVFVAVAGAAWSHDGFPARWPARRGAPATL